LVISIASVVAVASIIGVSALSVQTIKERNPGGCAWNLASVVLRRCIRQQVFESIPRGIVHICCIWVVILHRTQPLLSIRIRHTVDIWRHCCPGGLNGEPINSQISGLPLSRTAAEILSQSVVHRNLGFLEAQSDTSISNFPSAVPVAVQLATLGAVLS